MLCSGFFVDIVVGLEDKGNFIKVVLLPKMEGGRKKLMERRKESGVAMICLYQIIKKPQTPLHADSIFTIHSDSVAPRPQRREQNDRS